MAERVSLPTPAPVELSIVVVAYRMPRQAENTLYSLSAHHQRNVRESDYEIVLVENHSDQLLGEERACAVADNVRYFLRDEPGQSPAPALNFGVERARGRSVCIMIDGARMVSPRVVEHFLLGLRLCARPIVIVPGYHLGQKQQHENIGYSEAEEEAALAALAWKQNGYRLYEIACFDPTNNEGTFSPYIESTCFCIPRQLWTEIGGCDERFVLAGGGIVNLDLFDQLCRLPDTKMIVLAGEGAFHQFHGGVSTRRTQERDAYLKSARAEYERIRGRPFAGFDREPMVFGTLSPEGAPLFEVASKEGRIRHLMIEQMGREEWPND